MRIDAGAALLHWDGRQTDDGNDIRRRRLRLPGAALEQAQQSHPEERSMASVRPASLTQGGMSQTSQTSEADAKVCKEGARGVGQTTLRRLRLP